MDDEIRLQKARLQSVRWRAANREQHRASVKAWRLANPERVIENDRRHKAIRKAKRLAAREVMRAATAEARASAKVAQAAAERQRARARYQANRERFLEEARKRREANPGKSAAAHKAWREKNRDKVRANKRARKATKRVTLVRDLNKLQRGKCAYCRIKLDGEFHVDHVTPLKRGGPDLRSNLQLTCVACNLSKSATDPVDFARSIGRLL